MFEFGGIRKPVEKKEQIELPVEKPMTVEELKERITNLLRSDECQKR